jgi:hypothetical protein
MTIDGVVNARDVDDTGCAWVGLAIDLRVGDETRTSCSARLAVPTEPGDNPWSRRGERWKP